MTKNKQLLISHYLYGCKQLRRNILDLIMYASSQEELGMTPTEFLELCELTRAIKKIEKKLTWSRAIYTFLDYRLVNVRKDIDTSISDIFPF